MVLPTTQVSAPGLTEDQLQAEKTWIRNFVQDGDSLDWSRWEKWWADGKYIRDLIDAFLQFGNAPRIEGREAIRQHLEPQLEVLELMQHEIIRLSFDPALGLIYQTTVVTYKIKGDPQGRSIQVPGLGVIHKRVGEGILRGFDIYIDKAPVEAVVKEVLGVS